MGFAEPRMEWKGRAVQAFEDQAATMNGVQPSDAGLGAGEELVEAEVRRARLPPAGDLEGLHADLDGEVQRLLERQIADGVGVQANLHLRVGARVLRGASE